MRIHTKDKDLRDYRAGERIMVDVSYQSATRQRPAQLVEGIVETSMDEPLRVKVGSGEKVHDARGLMVSIDAADGNSLMNWNGDHWFGIRPKCQEYRGRGLNWVTVSSARVVTNGTTSCSKCRRISRQ